MKKILLGMTVLGVLLFTGSILNAKPMPHHPINPPTHQLIDPSTHRLIDSSTRYQCPMHSKIQSDKPGDCSLCGMALEKAKPAPVKKIKPIKKPVKAK